MALIDRINECHAWTRERFVPFVVDTRRLGSIRRDHAALLASFGTVFDVRPDAVVLADGARLPEQRTERLAAVVASLIDDGHIPALAHENYPIAESRGSAELFRLDRAALPFFGARAYGVHLNGYVRRDGGLHLWVAKRSAGKTTFPGQLDNLVAGGQPVGLGVRENLAKECAEEADIDARLAARAVACGAVSYRVDAPHGMRDDTLFLFDLELPENFVPRNSDGEVESFMLRPVAEVREIVAETRDYKFNCNLVVIDFLIRHGVIEPDEPGYLDLVTALRPLA